MTDSTKTVFEKYQVRKTKAQKSRFIEYVQSSSDSLGYKSEIEKGHFGARNIVVGDPKKAKVVYTAHYDTCAVLPFPNFITPKNMGIYIIYNLALTLALLLIAFVSGAVIVLACAYLGLGESVARYASRVALLAVLCLICFGPANKHTANDNTSGVTALLDLMAALPEEKRAEAAFIFFDLEESGLFGSMKYAAKHNAAIVDKLLINFDCVSDGSNMIFALRRDAAKYAPSIRTAFEPEGDFKVFVETKGVFYPSDQMCFPCGVGVAALRSTKSGILYMDKIHTKRDTVYLEENIEFLVRGSIKLLDTIPENL